jgi:hypothetical protein
MQRRAEICRDAVLLAQRTDSPQLIGDAMMDLSSVVKMAGRRVEAAELALNSMKQFEHKGNLVALGRAQLAYDAT